MRICIPIREKTVKRAVLQIKKAQKYADFIEIWLGAFRISEIRELIVASKRPVIAVCHGIKESKRILLLEEAAQCGAKYVDCDVNTDVLLIKKLKKACRHFGAKIIVSLHIWKNTPELSDLLQKARAARALADIIKIGANIRRPADSAILFELMRRLKDAKISAIIVGMGKQSKIARIGCVLLGGFLTYVALDKKSRTEEGQPVIKEIASFRAQ